MKDIEILTKKFITKELKYITESKKLSDKEIKIIKLYYGVNCEKKSLKEIAKKVDIRLKDIKDKVYETERKLFNILKKKI